MRGLAFPPNAVVDRETSYEYGTPVSNVDDIPIDPALGQAAIDPALMSSEQSMSIVPHNPPPMPEHLYPQEQLPLSDEYQIRQYSQGPQGDPFAPPIPFFPQVVEPVQPRPPPPPQKPKRKRKVYKEEECSFCQGKEENKNGQVEALLTCHECGRSGHPTCMQLENLGDVVRSYLWKCIECKNCEVCQEKGDDERILFCDWCDRGWHMDCMEPPLETPPEGEWHCPLCPPISSEDQPLEYIGEEGGDPIPMESVRESSVASSSRLAIDPDAEPTPTKPRKNRKSTGKKKAKIPKAPVSSDGEDDVEEMPVITPRPRGRPKGSVRKVQPPPVSSDDDNDNEELSAPTTRRKRARPSSPTPVSRVVRLRIPPQRGKGKEREEEEPSHGLFDDFLNPDERDTSKTTPFNSDKLFFERSRMMAEEKLAPPPPPPPTGSTSRTMNGAENSTPAHSRPLRSAALQHVSTPRLIDIANSPGPSTPGGPSLQKLEPGVLRIRSIRFGPYDIKTWYDAPFPEEYASIPDGRLWICEFCLKYMKSRFMAVRHVMKCKVRHPPGDEIYRDGIVSIFEVDGRRNKIYCQNLCLLSKMFLDHKSLFYDVEPFLFYVITQVDDLGARFVGYFSKEKRCPKDYNLSCIMTLPVRQRQGWGNLLMDFSYLLSKIEQRLGSPEKPLSSLGALGYRNYWTLAIMRFLEKAPDNVRLEDISSATSMTIEDVCNTLIHLNMIFIRESTPPPIRPSPGQSIKFPKGRKNGVARKALQKMQAQEKDADGNKAPFVPPKHYEIHFDLQKVNSYLKAWEAKGYVQLKPEKLQWTPYLVSRTTQEAAVTVDLPSRDNIPDESSKPESVVPESLPVTEPATPAQVNGINADSPPAQIQEDEQPMVVDIVSPPLRMMTRTPRTSFPTPPPFQQALRTRSSHANFPSPFPDLSTVGQSTSTRSTRRNGRKKAEDNEGLAATAQIPVEEPETPSARILRSGRGDAHAEEKRPASKGIPRVRKRRRIESSPENVEIIEAGEVGSKEPVPSETNNDGSLVASIDCDIPAGSPPKVNGNHNGHLEGAGCNNVGGMGCETMAREISPPADDTMATAEEEAVAREVLAIGRPESEVKSEDGGTPLTNLTGRQSVRSDDTVFMTEMNMNKYNEYHGAVHAESDLRSTLVGGEMMMNLDDCHDEDADGEYELDEDADDDDGQLQVVS